VATKTKPMIGTPKCILTVMWGMKVFHVVNLMASQNQFNSQYSVEHIILPLIPEIFPYDTNRRALRLHFHLNNCRVHFSTVAERFCETNDIRRIPHPTYGPYLAPADFWLFGRMRTAFVGAKFDEPEQVLDAVSEFLDTISVEELRAVLTKRWKG
jgi:hypothetical protein